MEYSMKEMKILVHIFALLDVSPCFSRIVIACEEQMHILQIFLLLFFRPTDPNIFPSRPLTTKSTWSRLIRDREMSDKRL